MPICPAARSQACRLKSMLIHHIMHDYYFVGSRHSENERDAMQYSHGWSNLIISTLLFKLLFSIKNSIKDNLSQINNLHHIQYIKVLLSYSKNDDVIGCNAPPLTSSQTPILYVLSRHSTLFKHQTSPYHPSNATLPLLPYPHSHYPYHNIEPDPYSVLPTAPQSHHCYSTPYSHSHSDWR